MSGQVKRLSGLDGTMANVALDGYKDNNREEQVN